MAPTVVALTFAAIFVVELPDKTFLATLVLTTRFRPLFVWLGVGAAFAVQTGIAVALGTAASFLPATVVQTLALVMFTLGGGILLREARAHQAAAGSAIDGPAPSTHAWRSFTASFLVLFAAEWGDLSQLLTLTLVARYADPASVFVGALGALWAVSGLAVLLGRVLASRVPLHRLHYAGAAVCFLLAAFTAYELLP